MGPEDGDSMFKRNGIQFEVATNTYKEAEARVTAAHLQRANLKAEQVASDTHLFGVYILEQLDRVLLDYQASTKSRIKTGALYEPWTERKISESKSLLAKVEDALTDSQHQPGDVFLDSFLQILRTFKLETLPSLQKEVQGAQNIGPGSLETKFLPKVEQIANIVFRIFKVYDIHDLTGKQLEEYSVEAKRHLKNVVRTVEGHLNYLLHDDSPQSLSNTEAILTDIEKIAQQQKLYQDASKADAATSSLDQMRSNFLAINAVVVAKRNGLDNDSIQRALSNYATQAKHVVGWALNLAGSVANSAYSMVAGAPAAAQEKVLDMAVGQTKGPGFQDDDDDSDDEARAARYGIAGHRTITAPVSIPAATVRPHVTSPVAPLGFRPASVSDSDPVFGSVPGGDALIDLGSAPPSPRQSSRPGSRSSSKS